MPTSEIQAAVDAIASQQVDNEMGTQRYALLFRPGTYGTPQHDGVLGWAAYKVADTVRSHETVGWR